MVLAHRWSAEHIHGHTIDGLQVDHCCPAGPSTLCVEHVQPEPAAINRELQHTRPGRPLVQALETKQYWLFVQKGLEPPPIKVERNIELDIPFFVPPAWLLPHIPQLEVSHVCPF